MLSDSLCVIATDQKSCQSNVNAQRRVCYRVSLITRLCSRLDWVLSVMVMVLLSLLFGSRGGPGAVPNASAELCCSLLQMPRATGVVANIKDVKKTLSTSNWTD